MLYKLFVNSTAAGLNAIFLENISIFVCLYFWMHKDLAFSLIITVVSIFLDLFLFIALVIAFKEMDSWELFRSILHIKRGVDAIFLLFVWLSARK